MDTVISLAELTLYIVAILAFSMSVTWLVVKVSPSESAKQQRAQAEGKSNS
jgi:hypothetical protein